MMIAAKKTGSDSDFLDDVVDEMGSEGGSDYGSDMEEEGEGGDDETVKEDGLMATRQLMKAAGLQGDAGKVYDALKAIISTCM